MKRLILFASLAVMFFAGLANAQSTPTRKVLLEEFTGSWCGWCPRGIWAIQQLETKYPNNFIPVAFHNSDPMDIPTGQDTLEASVSGYPDGWLDRNSFDGSTLNTDPANWDADVTAILAKT